MQLNLGQKIRELRRRDGRKQEDLANALGVTCQAVSRWEAGGGYPDMEMVPAIANYFNISIDELFGYSKDRQEKIKVILDKTELQISAQGDMTECIETLRDAIDEFPSEPKILINLGYALCLQGWKKYGAKSYTKDDSDYTYEDKEYNSGNIYWQEAISVYERALSMDISPEERDAVTLLIVTIYAKMGYNEKAKALALKQNSIINSKEILLTHATEAEERDKYQGEAIISLLTELKNVLCNSVSTKISLFTKTDGIKLLVDLAHLYEAVFSDGKGGISQYHLCELYLHAAVFEARFGDNKDKAFEYFKKGFEHKKHYEAIRCKGEYQYTSPLVARVTFPSENLPSLSPNFWTGWIDVMPEEMKEYIKAMPEYAECFDVTK